MARGTTVTSSLPAADPDPADEIDLMDQEEEFEEEPDSPELVEAKELGFETVEAMEADAARQGWKPLSHFRGAPGTHKTAAQFIRDGRNFLPFVQKENRDLKDQMARTAHEVEGMRAELEQNRADMRKLLEFSRNASKSAYDKARREILAEQRAAVAEGDTAGYDRAQLKLDAMEEVRDPAPDSDPPPNPKPRVEVDPAIDSFIRQNPWFMSDPVLNMGMKAAHQDVINKHPAMAEVDRLERAKQNLMRQYPEKFGIDPEEQAPVTTRQPQSDPPARRRPAGHTAPQTRTPALQRQAPGADGVFTIDSIQDPKERADARKSFQRAKASMPDITEAEWAEVYLEPHTDVLDVRSRARK